MIDGNKCKAVYTLNKATLDAINDALLSDDCKTQILDGGTKAIDVNIRHREYLEMMRKSCSLYQGVWCNTLEEVANYLNSF